MRSIILPITLVLLLELCLYKLIRYDYTEKTIARYESLPKPVTLYYKEKATFWYSVVLKDGRGDIQRLGGMSNLANNIGENYTIDDTIHLEPSYLIHL